MHCMALHYASALSGDMFPPLRPGAPTVLSMYPTAWSMTHLGIYRGVSVLASAALAIRVLSEPEPTREIAASFLPSLCARYMRPTRWEVACAGFVERSCGNIPSRVDATHHLLSTRAPRSRALLVARRQLPAPSSQLPAPSLTAMQPDRRPDIEARHVQVAVYIAHGAPAHGAPAHASPPSSSQ